MDCPRISAKPPSVAHGGGCTLATRALFTLLTEEDPAEKLPAPFLSTELFLEKFEASAVLLPELFRSAEASVTQALALRGGRAPRLSRMQQSTERRSAEVLLELYGVIT